MHDLCRLPTRKRRWDKVISKLPPTGLRAHVAVKSASRALHGQLMLEFGAPLKDVAGFAKRFTPALTMYLTIPLTRAQL